MNRYATIGGESVSYDDAGNVTVDHNGYGYVYDYENRITRIYDDVNTNGTYDSGTDTDIAEYYYDTLSCRICKVDSIASETTLYYYNDQWQVLQEFNGTDATAQRYFVYGNYIDEVLIMNDGTDDYYYAHDHLYSPVALIEDDGDVIGRYEYDAYGRMTRFDPDFTPWSGTEAGNPYYFTGRRLDVLDDGDLDIMYYRNRYYDTETGRFLTQDPMGIVPNGQIAMNPFSIHKQYKDGMSIYEYVKNNPVIFSDSSGLGFPSDEDTKDFDACVKGCDDDFDLCMATARILRDLCLQVAIDAIGICRDDCRDLPFPLDYVCMVGCGAGGGIAISMCMSAYAGAGTGCSLGFFICFDTCRGDCSTGRNRPF